jgi:DNA polymerase-3 subunit epsilon
MVDPKHPECSESRPNIKPKNVIGHDKKEQIMNRMDFTAIDFETANANRHSICQIGICRFQNGNLVSTDSLLVQPPGNEYSHWNIGIHGISPDRTKFEPFFPDVWNKIRHHFEDQLLVAHNADFDLDCLFKTLEYYNLDFPRIEFECTYQLSGMKLIDLAESLELEIKLHHHALNDAIMCAESYIKLKNGIKPNLQKVTNKQSRSLFAGHEKLCGNVLRPDLEHADCNSPFFGKKCVFTGVLSEIGREKAANIVKKMGADIDTGITKRTDYVIIGSGAGPSKLKKIDEYNSSGSNINMIYESEFLEMIKHAL